MKKNCPRRCDLCFGDSWLFFSLCHDHFLFNTHFLFSRASGSRRHANATASQPQGQAGSSRKGGGVPLWNQEPSFSTGSQVSTSSRLREGGGAHVLRW